MDKDTKLVAQARGVSGSAAARRLRREGWLPGILNSGDGASHAVQLNRHDFELLLHHHASESMVLDLEVDGAKPRKVLLKEVQHDGVTGEPLHADFVEISMTEKMRVPVPVTLLGEAIGVVQDGGILDQPTREVEVECLPTDLVEELTIDVTALTIGDSVTVADLVVDPKLTIVTPGDVAIASVGAPRIEEEEEPAEEEVEGAEPEVIGEEGKEEGDEGDEGDKGAKKGEETDTGK
jgi:large subunit ribosomal protein L25